MTAIGRAMMWKWTGNETRFEEDGICLKSDWNR